MSSDLATTTNKRRRTDDQEAQIHKNEELWLPDGNIVLVASDGTAYRVLKSFLGLHSEIFRDLFSASSTSADEKFDDCDVVRLPDPPEDLYHFLMALHFRSHVATKPGTQMSLVMLCSLMRTCSKYLVEDLKEEVKTRLMTVFPSTLNEYRSSTRLNGVKDYNGILGVMVGECLPIILPVAYYECAIGPIEDILDGVDIGGQRFTLSPEAQRTALLFHKSFRDHVTENSTFARQFNEERSMRARADECQQIGLDCAFALESDYYRQSDYNVITSPITEDQECIRRWKICESCVAILNDIETEFQCDVWDLLPAWCGLEDWDALEDNSGAQ